MKSPPIYPPSTLRTLALYTQGLTTPNGSELPPGMEQIYRQVEQLGCIQIDTLHVVQRSHYLVLWSRLGCFDPGDFNRLIYDPEHRKLFEGWQHAATIIPLADYRYQMPHQRRLREHPAKYSTQWLSEPGTTDLLHMVRQRIQLEGGLRASDFAYDGPRRGSWWDWKPAKNALEHLYAWGELAISNRINFQRVYDLTERVLPAWVELSEPSPEERDRYWIEMAVRALGVCTPTQSADYTYMGRIRALSQVKNLLEEGTLLTIKGRLSGDEEQDLIIHRDHLPLLEQTADGAILPLRTTFLSPFDSLFWARGRDMQLWKFRSVLEAYKPALTRIWGYFCLPILYKDRLIGRLDPVMDRKNKRLVLKSLYLEEGFKISDEFIGSVAKAMLDFMAFHGANELVIENSQPAEFGGKLLAAL